jgi:hypothetical protein
MKLVTRACRLYSSGSLDGINMLSYAFVPSVARAWNRTSPLLDAVALAGAAQWIKSSLHHGWITREKALQLARL